MNLSPPSNHGYRPVKQFHKPCHKHKGSFEGRERRLLCIVKVVSVIYIITGILTTVLGSLLIAFALGEPKFTFSTGLPLLVGILDLLGAFILFCISVTRTRFRTYTSSQLCKWQCALLCFCHIGVLAIGTTSLMLTFCFNHVNYSLLNNNISHTTYSLGLGSTVLIVVDLVGVICSMSFFCIFKQRCDSGPPSRFNQPHHNNVHIERELHHSLLVLNSLLSRYAIDHTSLARQADVTSSSSHGTHKAHPQVDRKGYYVWEPL